MKLSSLWPVAMILLLATVVTATEQATDRIVLLQVEITDQRQGDVQGAGGQD